jgi:putative transposase
MDNISFARRRFPPDIICHAVWLYARFTLSYRDVDDLLAERGLDVSDESVRPTSSDFWHLDERVIVI